MQVTEAEDQIAEINRKLDLIAEELSYQKRHRLEMEDLKDDLTIVGKDFYQTAVAELEELSESFRAGDLVFLLKKLLRNTNNLTKAFEQLESIRDFLVDLRPISREVYNDALAKMEALERKGYFQFAGGAASILDALVVSHSRTDLEQAQASVPHLVGFLRELTRPEVLQALEAIVYGFGEVQATATEEMSMLRLLRELNSPEARRGLAIIIKFLSVVGKRSGAPALGKDGGEHFGKE